MCEINNRRSFLSVVEYTIEIRGSSSELPSRQPGCSLFSGAISAAGKSKWTTLHLQETGDRRTGDRYCHYCGLSFERCIVGPSTGIPGKKSGTSRADCDCTKCDMVVNVNVTITPGYAQRIGIPVLSTPNGCYWKRPYRSSGLNALWIPTHWLVRISPTGIQVSCCLNLPSSQLARVLRKPGHRFLPCGHGRSLHVRSREMPVLLQSWHRTW